MSVVIRAMTIEDYDHVCALWENTPEVLLVDADSRKGVESYLLRNPGISQVAESENRIVGAVLGGHDGRRGYLHHLAVAEECRGQGVGTKLVQRVLRELDRERITRCNLFVFEDNPEGKEFWQKNDWSEWVGLRMMSTDCTGT